MAHSIDKLGDKLKIQRTRKGFTLDQLSKAAGVSKAMLCQIEQNKVNPTIVTIMKVADALGISIGELVENSSRKNILRVIPEDDLHYNFSKDQSCSIRTLSPLSLEKSIEFYRITLDVAGQLDSEPHFADAEEFLHLSKGKIAITSGNEKVELNKGDSIHYRADVAHKIANVGKSQAEAFLIVYYKK